MNTCLHAMAVLALMISLVVPTLVHASDDCAQLAEYVPPGSLAITHGQVTGQSGEHAPMTSAVPWPGSKGRGVGYLVTGDQVDFVTACQGFSYVRYHGRNRTTTGWIDSQRLRLQGRPLIPLPVNTSQLCSVAAREVNDDTLAAAPWKNMPEGFHLVDESNPVRPNPLGYTPVNVESRPLAVLRMSEGGTCYSVLAVVMTGDLKHRLSPADIDSRNPVNLNVRGNGWAMGLSEDVVSVEGHALIRSSQGVNFELSSIDKTGDTQLVCHGRLRPLIGKPVVIEGDHASCEALASTAQPIAMKPAEERFTAPPQDAPEVRQTAMQWGMADLDNTGHARPVGVINYNFLSSAGCGQDFALQFPLLLDGKSVSDAQAKAAFQAFYGDEKDLLSRPSDRRLVRLVRYGNQVYVELLDAGLLPQNEVGPAPLQSVWKFGPSGPKQVCEYRTRHYEVAPPLASEVVSDE